jgi:hypothetical protein
MPERRIGDFFIELVDNPQLQSVVDRHWDEIAAEWGLDDEQRAILQRRDPTEIRRRIVDEYGDAATGPIHMIFWGWMHQGPWSPGPPHP